MLGAENCVLALDGLLHLPVLSDKAMLFCCVAYNDEEFFPVEGLLEKIIRAETGRFDRRLDGAVT